MIQVIAAAILISGAAGFFLGYKYDQGRIVALEEGITRSNIIADNVLQASIAQKRQADEKQSIYLSTLMEKDKENAEKLTAALSNLPSLQLRTSSNKSCRDSVSESDSTSGTIGTFEYEILPRGTEAFLREELARAEKIKDKYLLCKDFISHNCGLALPAN